MTKARIQPFCRANNINLGYYDGIRVFPRSVTDRKNALFFYNNHFCLIWKSEGVSFSQGTKELKNKLEIVDNYITEENVKTNSYQRKLNLIQLILLYMILKHIIEIEQDHIL